ncbi:MAG: MerR family transcriptional regulator [Pseudomonadota bacterium]
MAKSADAFRTISEVADWLGVPTHVLRFWESKFPQVKPVKRAGGRRYYRPNDMLLLGGIRVLLHDDGMTIRGVQKILREKGVKHVVALSDRQVAGDAPDPAATTAPGSATESETAIADIADAKAEETAPISEETPTVPGTAASAPTPLMPEQEDSAEPDSAKIEADADQMALFEPAAPEDATQSEAARTEEPAAKDAPESVSESSGENSAGLPDLPGPSPVGGPSLGPLLEQINSASPEVAREMRRVVSAHKDKLEALRDRLRDGSDRSESDTDT